MDKAINLYNRLTYKTNQSGGPRNWVGNLRWYVAEKQKGCFSFLCISALPNMTHQDYIANGTKRKLFTVHVDEEKLEQWVYGAAYIEAKTKTDINYSGIVYEKDGCLLINEGDYYICFDSCSFSVNQQEQIITLSDSNEQWLTVTYHVDEAQAISNCHRLSANREETLKQNKVFWESYLESCPTTEINGGFAYKHESLNIDEKFSSDEILTRQLWHYWCMLVNVSDVEFNKFPIYMAPDKDNWIGTWSNDGPQCMAALSLTNQKEFSKRIIISYLTNAMNDKGEFSWYMHADGVGCFGTKGDVGRFSHGDPYMPHVVEFYIRNTGDTDILSADVGGMTVYEKLRTYMLNLHNLRDMNDDSLIEWSNLWETGWDDKGGTFFTSAGLYDWMDIVSKGTDEDIAAFYAEHQRPVIAVVEQVITLWSLRAMEKLATIKDDKETAKYCSDMYQKMKIAVSERCWNEQDKFYYDIDVKTGLQTTEKCADAFFWLNFEDDKERSKFLLKHLNDENEFNCYYIPMLSKDSVGFNQFGYWSGGHWPREMSIIAMGLHHCGYDDKALELLIRAIMVDDGNIIAEVREPLGGKPSTSCTKMACAIMNVVALLDITEQIEWFRD